MSEQYEIVETQSRSEDLYAPLASPDLTGTPTINEVPAETTVGAANKATAAQTLASLDATAKTTASLAPDLDGGTAASPDTTGFLAVSSSIADGTITAPKLATDVPLLRTLADEVYAFAVLDALNRAALTIDLDGTVRGKIELPAGAVTTAMLAPDVSLLGPGSVTLAMLASDVSLYQASPFGIDYAKITVDQDRLIAEDAIGLDGRVPQWVIDRWAARMNIPVGGDDGATMDVLPEATGYAFAITDTDGRMALGITPDGTIVMAKSSTESLGSTSVQNASYLIEPFLDAGGKYQLRSHRRADGQLFTLTSGAYNNYAPQITEDDKVLYRTDQAGAAPSYIGAEGGSIYPQLAAPDLACWGDSLTQGAGGSIGGFPAVLATALGVSAYNGGIGGQNSRAIAARQGGMPAPITIAGNEIPASGSVTVTSTVTWTAAGTFSRTGTLMGVPGTLTWTLTGGVLSFARTTPGSVVACPAGSPFIFTDALAQQTKTAIFWSGRNGVTVANTIPADIAGMVAYLKPYVKRYLVLGILSQNTEITGTAAYDSIVAMNTSLATTYGANFFDMRRYLIDDGLADAVITPTVQDDIDIAGDTVPVSLRADNVHLNNAGYTVVGNKLAALLISKGWYV